MKKIVVIAIVALSLMIVGLAALPFMISSESVKHRLSEQMMELTGGAVSYKGKPTLSLVPFLQVEIQDVILPGVKSTVDDENLLYIDKLQFNLDLLPLFIGKISLSGFKLIRPKITLLSWENGQANWNNLTAENDNGRDKPSRQIELGSIEIIDGIVEAFLATNSQPIRVSNLNANMNWSTLSSPWTVSGNGVWSGEAFKFSNSLQNPAALFSAGKSAMQFSLNSAAVDLSFNGTANGVSGIQLLGSTKFETPSMPRLIDLFASNKNLIKPQIGSLAIEGEISADIGEVKFDQASVKIDNNLAVGNLQFIWKQQKPTKITGTLAFSSLDVAPLISILTSNGTKNGSGNVEGAEGLDFDIRFSAQNYKIGDTDFGAMAATAIVSADQWTFDIGEADFFGGMLIAKISSTPLKGSNEIEIDGVLQNIDFGSFAEEFHGGRISTSGVAKIKFNLKAMGKHAVNDFTNFSGSISAQFGEGQLEGLDLIKAIPALANNDGFVTLDEVEGATPFQKLQIDMLVHNGVGWITKGAAENEANSFRLSGKTDLINGGLAIYADVRNKSNSNTAPEQQRLFIGGSINAPLVTRTPFDRSSVDSVLQNNG